MTENQTDKKRTREEIRQEIKNRQQNRTLRDLSIEEKIRAKKLEDLLVRVEQGESIDNRTLRRWLSQEDFDSIGERWQSELAKREQWKDIPFEIKDYDEALRKALLIYGQAEYQSCRGNQKASNILFQSAESKFEKLLERLEEISAMDAYLHRWFDRDLDFSPDGNLGPNPDEMPRVITSRSSANRYQGFDRSIQKKSDIKTDILKNALEDLLYEPAQLNARPSSKVEQLLKMPDDDFE